MNAASGAVLVVALECPTLAIALETMFTKVAPLTLSLFYQTEERVSDWCRPNSVQLRDRLFAVFFVQVQESAVWI